MPHPDDRNSVSVSANTSEPSERFARALPVHVAIEEIDPLTDLECGLRQVMVETENEGMECSISSGGGLGSPWITVSVRLADAEPRHFRIDGREILTKLIRHCEAKKG